MVSMNMAARNHCSRPIARGLHGHTIAKQNHPKPPPRLSFQVKDSEKFGLGRYRQRSILALTLMVAQSFLYNSVFFTFGLIIANFYHVPNEQVGLYLFPLTIGNFCGPLLLGTLFDTFVRKKMIAGTFAMSGVLLLITAYMFGAGLLSAITQTIAWCIIF
jgi:predicted MFS family arabinose efflux permease